ncbi:MAG: hypothetical protein EXS25_07125 [Pedosphaera sp.]|nr:hypothetical protein [Pedosphaera sp.]
MNKANLIGLKYVVLGLFAFVITTVVVSKLIATNITGSIGASAAVAVFSGMLMFSTSDAYNQGKKDGATGQ